MLCDGGSHATQDLIEGRRLVCWCNFLPDALWQEAVRRRSFAGHDIDAADYSQGVCADALRALLATVSGPSNLPRLQASLQFPSEPKVSTDSKEFIARCLSRDPRNRPSVLQVRLARLFSAKIDRISLMCRAA